MANRSIQAENLHLWRGDNHVLAGVNLTVNAGEVVQVRGANGSGKTSLLRALCGLIHPEEGRVLWGDRDVQNDMRAFHEELVYLGHEPPLKADLSAQENLRYWVGVRRTLTLTEVHAALARVGADASSLYARNVLDFLKLVLTKEGGFAVPMDDDIVAACLMTQGGEVKRK